MQDQPVVGLGQPGFRHDAEQLGLDLVRRAGIGQTQTVRDPEHMGVDGDGRLDAQFVQHHAGGLAADAGQGLEVGAVQRHLPAMLFQHDAAQGDDVLRLVPVQADGGDEGDQPRLSQFQHLRRGVGDREQSVGGLVDRHVRGLGRQGDGDHQRIGAGEAQLGLRLGHDPGQPFEDRLDPVLVGRPDEHGDRRAGHDGGPFRRGLGGRLGADFRRRHPDRVADPKPDRESPGPDHPMSGWQGQMANRVIRP